MAFTDGFNAKDLPLGYQQVTDLSEVTSPSVPNGARFALNSVDGKTVRWTDDGQTPTPTFGMPQGIGTTLIYEGDLSSIRFIETAPSAILDVRCYD